MRAHTVNAGAPTSSREGEGAPRRVLSRAGVAGVRHRPALLREHRHLLEGQQWHRTVEALARDVDELGGSVLQGQRPEEREPDGGVDLGSVRAGEQRLGPLGRLDHPAGAQQRLHDLRRHRVRVRVAGGQQRLGAQQEVDRDEGCLRGRVAGRLPQPGDGLEVTLLRPEHEVVRHLEPVGPGGRQRHRRLAVEEATGGRRRVLVDRVVDELVAEHHPVVDLVEQLGVERLAETP